MNVPRILMLLLMAAAVCLVSVGLVAAEDDFNITKIGHFGGSTYAVEVSGNYAYIGQGGDFVVLDINNKSVPIEIGRVETNGIIHNINISGSYAYIADNWNGFVIVDISNPTEPMLAGSFNTAGRVRDVVVSGSYAYITDSSNGLLIIDISNPAEPVLAGSYSATIFAQGVAVSGSYAYVADNTNGLVIVDISNPAEPVFTSRYDTQNAMNIAVSGNYAYVGDSYDGIVVINISNPAAPTLAWSGIPDPAGTVRGVAVSGSYAYVADGSNGLMVIDISNQDAPILKSSYDTTGNAWGVAISGSYAYVADSNGGLVIIDVSNKIAPTLTGSYDTFCAESVAVSGSYAYVADSSNGLKVIDIRNPVAPALAGIYDTAGIVVGFAESGSYAYVANGSNGLLILDINNPAKTVLAGDCDAAGTVVGFAVSGSYAYVANGSNGLLIIDVSNPAEPVLAGSFNTAGLALDVAVSGNYAYVADRYNGLLIIDISNPAEPVLAGSYSAKISARGVAVSSSYAYVASASYGLVIIDISNPAAPTLAGSNYWIYSNSVAVSGSYAYVADYFDFAIVDISNKTAPVLVWNYDTEGWVKGVAVSGSYAYVADYDNGLVILRTDEPVTSTTPPSLTITSPTNGITVTTQTITVSGTASDVASVTVNGILATGTTSWSKDITLAEGTNTITVVATDTEGNTATQTVTVTYAPSTSSSSATLSTALSDTYALGEPVILTTSVKNTGATSTDITLEISSSNGYSTSKTSTVLAGSTYSDSFNLDVSTIGTQTVTTDMYAGTTLLDSNSKIISVSNPLAVKFVEDEAESLKKAAISEFDKMAGIPSSATSNLIMDFGFDRLKDSISNQLSSPTDAVKDEDTSGSITDSGVNSMVNEAETSIIGGIESNIDDKVSASIIKQINSASGTNIPETIDVFHLKDSVSSLIFEQIKNVFGNILTNMIKDYVVKPAFTQPEEDKVIIRDDEFDSYASSTLFSLTSDSETRVSQRFSEGRSVISSITDSKALFTVGPYFGKSYSVTLTEQQNKFNQIDKLKGLIGAVAAAIAIIGVVFALTISILGTGGTILAPLISALPSIISWLNTIVSVMIPIVMSLIAVGMFFTLPFIAPEVTYQHDTTLDTIEDIIASESYLISVSEMSTSSSYINKPSSMSIKIDNLETINVQPITETMILSPDGRIIDIQRQDPYISATSSTEITNELAIPSKPGTYNVVGMVHAGGVATSIAQQEMSVSTPSLSISMQADKSAYNLGDTVTISTDFTNNEATEIGDLMYVLEVINTTSAAAETMTLSASSTQTKTLAFTPDEEGSYIAKATLLLGLTEIKTESIGFTVGSGEGLLITVTADELYAPDTDVTIPTSVENIGTVHTDSSINITTYNQLAGFTQIYSAQMPVSLDASASTTFSLTVLPNAVPGIYRTILEAGDFSAESFEYTVTADGTIFTLLSTDKLYYSLTEPVTINTTVNDILFNATSATVNVTVSDPTGSVACPTVTGSLGQYSSAYFPYMNGTHDITATSTKAGFRSYDDETFIIVGQRSVITTDLDTTSIPYNESSVLDLQVINDHSKPIGDAIVTLTGCGVNSTKITGSSGNVSFSINPSTTGTITLAIEKGGYAGSTQTLTVSEITYSAGDPNLLFAITPTSRLAQVTTPVTIFLSVINSGTGTATDVSISQASGLAATIGYQAWNGVTLTGTPDTPVDIGAGEAAHFVLTINSTSEFSSSPMTFDVSSTNGATAPVNGVNTLTMAASSTPYADIIMMSTSLDMSTGVNTATAFAMSTTNVGTATATDVSLVVEVPTSLTGLSYQVNETNLDGSIKGPATGLTIPVGGSPTFAAFLTPTQAIDYDPANNRIVLKLVDGSGTVVGAQSVAVSTA